MRRAMLCLAMMACATSVKQESARTAEEDCSLTTSTSPLKKAEVQVPSGVSDAEMLNSVAQLLARGGVDIKTRDYDARVLVSETFTGQTLQTACGINEYRSYAIRVFILGRTATAVLDCWRSMGWESYVKNGNPIPARRGPVEPCSDMYAGVEATLPGEILSGAIALRDVDRLERASE